MGTYEAHWQRNFETLRVGADLLAGGDYKSKKGSQHMIAEPATGDYPTPDIYDDPVAENLRKVHGATRFDDKGELSDFAGRYELAQLPSRILSATQGLDPQRRQFISSVTHALDLVVQTSLADGGVDGYEMPSFEARYRASTKHTGPIRLLDVTERTAKLRRLLRSKGYRHKRLVDAAQKWERDLGILDGEEVYAMMPEIIGKLVPLAKERLIVPLVETLPTDSPLRDLADLEYDGMKFEKLEMKDKPWVTGSQSYIGGVDDDGSPKLEGLFEYNVAYAMTKVGLIELALHEFMPGHYLQAVAQDLNELLGFEARLGTMGSPEVTLWEGGAQNTKEFMFDDLQEAYSALGRLFDIDPIDFEIFHLVDGLIDAGKHDGPILHQREGWSEQGVLNYMKDTLALPGKLPRKIWGWAAHPVIGAMYGVTYERGRDVVGRMIKEHGRIPTARVAFNMEGIVDIETFQRVLKGDL